MNKVYKIVWNASHQVWVAVSELAKGKVKSSSKALTAGAVIILLPAQFAVAAPGIRDLPSLNNIASGSATLTTTTGNLTVNQSSSKLIANWNSFNVGSAAKVTFNQPDASSIALNRISSAAPSEIFGRVTANGKLILVSPAGLTIGSTGQISAASVIASTLNISDTDFNADSLIFDRGTSTGEINNQGTILATAGSTALLAPSIRNSGTTRAISGNVTLANGNKLTVADTTVTLNQSSGIPGLIQSTGTIRADRLATTNGKVYLVGDRARAGSLVQLAGTLTSSGVDVKGKTVEVTGAVETNSSTNMNAINSININGAINVVGNNRLIGLVHGTGTGEGYFLGSAGKISLPGTGDKFRVNGQYFKLIQTLAQLQGIGANATTLGDKTYVIANDIDASSTATTSFTPLGNAGSAFTGTINGLGNSINNLTINKPANDNVGFVGYATSGELKNIRLTNANITGRNDVGGLVGMAYIDGVGDAANSLGILKLSNNLVSGTVKGKYQVGGLLGYSSVNGLGSINISGNTTNADVSGDNQVGGQIGGVEVFSGKFLLSGGQVDGLTHATTTTGGKYNIGGLIGYLSSDGDSITTVSNSVVNGAVNSTRATNELGGAFGRVNNYGNATTTLQNILNNGVISVFSDASNQSTSIGGLIGVAENYGGNPSKFIIDLASNTGNVSAGSNSYYVGGLVGYANNGITVSNAGSNAAITGRYYLGGLIGYMNIGTFSNSSAAGSVVGYDSVGGLIGQANQTTVTGSSAAGNVTGTEFVGGLIGRSDQTTVMGSSASGQVDGGTAGGLIGYLSNGSINNSHASGNVASTGSAGGLVASNNGASISNSYAQGTVAGQTYVGGLVGYTDSAIDSSYATGAVTGYSEVGGLVGSYYGYNNVGLQNSHATGSVSASSHGGGLVGHLYLQSNSSSNITNNYATGNVSAPAGGGDYLGGLIGQIATYGSNTRTLNISSNYAAGAVSGNGSVGGLIGSVFSYGEKVNIIDNNAVGAVTGNSSVGGLIGDTNAYGSNIYVTSNYAKGLVTGADTASTGGFIGTAVDNSGTSFITKNYWDKTSSGQTIGIGYKQLNRSAAVTGLTSTQMNQLASFVGWDISNLSTGSSSIWYVNEGVSAPVLRSLMTP